MATKEKTPINSTQFKTMIESNDYIVQEATNQFSPYDYINKVYIDNTLIYINADAPYKASIQASLKLLGY